MKSLALVLIFASTAFAPDVPDGYVYWKTLRVKATAYCPCYRCCGRHANGRTATNTNAWKPIGCAVNPKEIPYGTMVHIPGIGFRVADDRGPRGRNKVDVRFVYHWQARKFGWEYTKVRLYKRGRRMEGKQKEAYEIVNAIAGMIKNEKYGRGDDLNFDAINDDLDKLNILEERR